MALVVGDPLNFTSLDDEPSVQLGFLLDYKFLESTYNEVESYKNYRNGVLCSHGIDPQAHRPLNAPTATDPVAVNSNNNNNGKFQARNSTPTKAPGPKRKTNASSVTSTSVARVTGDPFSNLTQIDDELSIQFGIVLSNKWRLPESTYKEVDSNNNNGKFQELKLEQNISRTQASSLNTESVRQQNSDASNDSISSTTGFSQREICDPPIGDGGSASVHVASNRVTRDLIAVKKEDAAASNSISESTNFSIWKKVKTIESGGFGIVYVARNRETGDLCAVKELKDIHKLENPESLQKEIEILSQLEHTNVVKYHGHEIVGRHISLYMEYIQPGSLKKYIWKQGVLPEPSIRNFTAQILSGLVYLHSKRVVHRDLKPNNLLVDSNNNVKLVDFGLSKHLQESVGRHSVLGTLYYSAPEVVTKIKYQSSREAYAADIWSLGCVIIAMFTGNHPWHGFEPQQVIYKVGKKQHPPIPEKLCQEGTDFLKLCFTRTPADRPSASALLDHSFVKPRTTSLVDGRKCN